MTALQCDICGGKLIGKPNGIFECESCGTEYSTEWAKQKFQEIRGSVTVEGTVKVEGTVNVKGVATAESLMKRGMLELESENFDTAKECFDQVCDMDPENPHVYIGRLLCNLKLSSQEELSSSSEPFIYDDNFLKALKFADKAQKEEYYGYVYDFAENKRKNPSDESGISQCIDAYALLGKFKDSAIRLKELKDNRDARKRGVKEGIAAAGNIGFIKAYGKSEDAAIIAMRTDGAVLMAGNGDKKLPDLAPLRNAVDIDLIGTEIVAYVKADGTVFTKFKHDVSKWTDIVSISSTSSGTIAVTKDGTVLYSGNDEASKNAVKQWTNVKKLKKGGLNLYGLKKDGTVVSADKCYDTSLLVDIIDIYEDTGNIVGISKDGWIYRPVRTKELAFIGSQMISPEYQYRADKIIPFIERVVKFSVAGDVTALMDDGTVFHNGNNIGYGVDVGKWRDIVDIAQGAFICAGLKCDGTVIVEGGSTWMEDVRRQVEQWHDIVAITAGWDYLVGIRRDGTVVTTAKGLDLSGWKLFDDINNIAQERITAKEERRVFLTNEIERLRKELNSVSGIFAGKKKKELEESIQNAKSELKLL